MITYVKTRTGYLQPILPNYGIINVTWLISEWKRLCRYFAITCHADLADLQKIDYDAWFLGIKLEQILTRILQQSQNINKS